MKSAPTTELVSKISMSDGRTLAYEYDAEERITKVTDSTLGTTQYTYDALGQLLCETKDGTVVNTVNYDNYGNILSKNSKVYTYGDSTWRDLLTGFDGKTIAYDAQGNPTSYLGHTLTWQKGRQLKSFDSNSYTYNANGIRSSKTLDGVKHSYTLDGTRILREVWGGYSIVPLYDNDSSVCGIIYNNDMFLFGKNLQGDIITVYNENGGAVAKYSYDAWGKCTVVEDTSGCAVAQINPFRYRGYYYDSETAMYYLQSRYYDPETGRFINGDETDYLGTTGTSLSYNLFSYCENNPISNTDLFGYVRINIGPTEKPSNY